MKIGSLVIIASILILPNRSCSQNRIRNFIAQISNEQLAFNVVKVGTTRILDNQEIELPKNQVFVNSDELDILLKKVNKEELIKACVQALQDTTKDWYANMLLYQLTDKDASVFLIIESRKEWVNTNQINDIIYWKAAYPN
jgi:hypothetical protein